MKTTTPSFRTHLDGAVTTLCTIWRITRQDGEEFFFTDHDVDVVYDGNTYSADNGYSRTAVQNNSTLSVDNLDIMGVFDSSEITDEDIRAGLFDYAEIRISVLNWADLTQGELKVRRGHLGECILTPQGWFKAEMRGMTQNLSQNIGEVYQAECRADLGDSRCKVPIRPNLRLNSTQYAVGTFVRVPTDLSVVTTISGEPTEDAYEDRIYECTGAGITDPSQPVFDTVVGNTTTETGVKASRRLSLTGNPSNNQTLTIGGKVYNFRTSLTDVDGYVQIGATVLDTHANLLAALTLGAGAGTAYAASTTAHTTVDFASGPGTTIDATAKTPGSAGNAIGATETMSNASWSGSGNFLIGGIDGVEWTARESWTRSVVIDSVSAQDQFGVVITEPRAVADWYNGGGFIFETGNNAGFAIEVRDWGVQVYATGAFSFSGAAPNGSTVTINGKVYTFQTTLTNVDGNVLRGANSSESAANLAAAINLGAGSGTLYAASTTLNPDVSAANVTNSCNLTAKHIGPAGNSIALADSSGSITTTAMSGGAGGITTFLDAPFPVQVGDKARVYPGCDKRSATCSARFANILNFRGEPFVPGQDEITNYPDAH